MLGFAEGEVRLTVHDWPELIHPDDRPRVAQAMAAHMNGGTSYYETEHRLRHRDGAYRWVSARGVCVRDDGQPMRMAGSVSDITERKQAESRLRARERYFRALIEHSSEVVAVLNENGILTYVGPSVTPILGYESGVLVGTDAFALIHPEDREATFQVFLNLQQRHGNRATVAFRYRRTDGEWQWMEAIASNLLADPDVHGVVVNSRDVTDRKAAEERLRYQLKLEELLTTLATDFVNLPTDQVDAGIERALKKMAGFAAMDRAFVCLFSAEHNTLDCTHIWCAPDYVLRKEDFQNIPLEHFPWGMDVIMQPGVMCVSQVENMPEAASLEAAFIKTQGVRSLVEVPLVKHDVVIGLVGFVSLRAEHHWTDDESALLRIVAEMFVNALERRRVEQALIDTEQRFRATFEQAAVGITMVAPDGRFLRVNDKLCDILGYTPEELTKLTFQEVTHPDDLQGDVEHANRLLAGEIATYSIDKRYIRKDGSTIWITLTVSLVRAALGEPKYFVSVVQDIAARKLAENILRESELKFRTLAETMPAAIFIHQDDRLRYVNPAAGEITGYTRPELLALNFWSIMRPEMREYAQQQGLARLRGDAVPMRREVQIVKKDGAVRWVDYTAALIEFEGEIAVLGTAFDITERKQTSAALRKSEERFALAVAGTNEGLWDWNGETGEVYFSPRWKSLLGFADEELRSSMDEWRNRVHPDDYDRVAGDLIAHLSGQTAHYQSEHRMLHKDGTYRHMLARGVSLRSASGRPYRMVGSITDMTARKRAEEVLRENEAKFRALAETVTAAIFIYQDTRLRYVNPAAVRITGYAIDELLTMEFWEIIHPEFRDLVRARGLARQRGQVVPQRYEVKILCRDGTTRWVDFTGGVIDYAGERAALGTAFDITERRRAEDEARERRAELAHALRVRSMGEMAAGLAHEINQPLAAIVNYAKGCVRRLHAGHAVTADLIDAMEQIAAEAHRGGEIIRRLRRFIRKQPARRDWLQVNDLIGDVVSLFSSEARASDVILRSELAPELPMVHADAIQIQQVLVNLLRNGLDAISSSQVADRTLTICSRPASDNGIEILVADTGSGLSRMLRRRCSMRSLPPSRTGSAWACRSAAPSWKPTVGNCGSIHRWPAGASYGSGCRWTS